ncbi:MAG: carbohydrate ABC transporter permease [Candidatus Limivicinus sp.]|jgi:multiple sugar transport system permease protein
MKNRFWKYFKKALISILVLAVAILFVLPVIYTIVCSFKPEADILAWPPTWIPKTWTLDNYREALSKYNFLKWMRNSLIVSACVTVIAVVVDALAGYAFARLKFRGKKGLFALVVSMLLIPMQVYVVPMYLMFNEVKLLNTFTAVILPLAATVTGVYLLKGFFSTVPNEMVEAAYIDGANEFQLFFRVMLPLSKTSLASVAILNFVQSWNNFLWPMIVTRSDDVKTLPVGISQYVGASGTGMVAPRYGLSLASAVMALVPTIVIFLCLQKYFVRGIMTTGMKN